MLVSQSVKSIHRHSRFRASNPLSSSFSALEEEKKRESGEVENIGQALQEEAIVIVHPF